MAFINFRRCALFVAVSLLAIQLLASHGTLDISLVTSDNNSEHVVKKETNYNYPLKPFKDVVFNGRRLTESPPDQAIAIEVPFKTIYAALVFLVAVYAAGYIASNLSLPDLVGHIIVGVLLGPPLANYVPFPESFVMFGYMGIILLMVDAGINMDIAQLRVTGWRSVVMAHVGAFLSLAVGGIVAYFSKSVTIQGAVCLGAVFAPTSFGVSSNALISEKMINTPTGQIIVAAAIIDDLIALVILSVVQQWVTGGSDTGVIQFLIPIISSVLFLVVGGYVAIHIFPKLLTKYVIARFPEPWQKQVAFILLVLLTMAYMPLMDVCKTNFITGAYLSGLSFNQIPCVDQSFKNNTKNIFSWLLRVFFSASIGFQVPLMLYGDPTVIVWGFAFYLAVLGKIPTGLFVPKSKQPKAFPFNRYWRDFIIVGVAMTCRGELSFFIATYAVASGLVSEQMYASAVWAAFLSSITSPIALRALIRYYNRLSKVYIESPRATVEGKADKMPMYWVIEVQTAVIPGFYDHLSFAINNAGLTIIHNKSWTSTTLEATVVTKIFAADTKYLIGIPSNAANATKLFEHCAESDKDRMGRHSKQQQFTLTDAISDSKSYSCSPSHALNCMEISKTAGEKSFLDTCFGAEASNIEHRRLEVASALLGTVESLGNHSVSIQVQPWMRAVILRAGEKDDVSVQKSLREEVDKESTESLRDKALNELQKLQDFI